MKATISIFLILFISIVANGQDFELTEKYVIIEPEFELDSIFWTTPQENRTPINVYLTSKSDTSEIIKVFSIQELETYDGNKVLTIGESGLSNTKEIVCIQFEYMACCSSIDNHYFIVTKNDEWIKLPVINYVACDGPEPFVEYRFPAQQFGQRNTIIKTTSYPNQDNVVDSVSVIETLIWDEKKLKITNANNVYSK